MNNLRIILKTFSFLKIVSSLGLTKEALRKIYKIVLIYSNSSNSLAISYFI